MALLLILVSAVLLPVLWLTSEFSDKRELRILLGLLAIGISFFVAFGVGSLRDFQSNEYFGTASKKLVETTIAELEAGNHHDVLTRLREMNDKYRPNYEWRHNYKELVDEYAEGATTTESLYP